MAIPASSGISNVYLPALSAAALRTALPSSNVQFKEAAFGAAGRVAGLARQTATGSDSSTVTAAVLDSLGILQNASPSAAANALSSLLAANLGVTAGSLESTATSVNDLALTQLFQGASATNGTDATAQAFSDLIIEAANIAATSVDVNSTLSGTTAPSDLQTALLNSTTLTVSSLAQADVTLVAAAGGSSNLAGATAAIITGAVAGVQNLTLDNISAIASNAAPLGLSLSTLPPTTPVVALQVPTEAAAPVTSAATNTVTAPPTVTAVPIAPIVGAATTVATNSTGAQFGSNSALQSLIADAVAQAVSTVATDPSYAAAAAQLYASAAVFHFMQAEVQPSLGSIAGSILPVLPVRRSSVLLENR